MAVVVAFVAYSQGLLAEEAERPVAVGTADTGLEEAAALDLEDSVRSRPLDLH